MLPATLVQHMWEQEKEHLELFRDLVERRRVRPSAFMPLWDILGYVLGTGWCKTWTMDYGLDYGLDHGLNYGLTAKAPGSLGMV